MLLLAKLPNFYILFQTREKQARTKSAELLKKELEKEENLGCTEYLTKVRSFVWFSYLFLFLFDKMSTKSNSLFFKYHVCEATEHQLFTLITKNKKWKNV